MKLKTMADEFLQRVLTERNNAIAEAQRRDIQEKHEPYKAQMMATRDTAIANEEQKFKALIEKLTKEHNDIINSVKEDFGKAIQAHREEIERSAEATASAEYDKFIKGVCTVADEIKLN